MPENTLAPAAHYVELNEWDYGDFYDFRVHVNRILSEDEVMRASGCIGYALKQHIKGEELSLPEVTYIPNATLLDFHYDSTKTQSDDPDFGLAFFDAETYVREGTPIRKTNRAGAGTKGTRLVEGIGDCEVRFLFKQYGPAKPALEIVVLTGGEHVYGLDGKLKNQDRNTRLLLRRGGEILASGTLRDPELAKTLTVGLGFAKFDNPGATAEAVLDVAKKNGWL